MDHAQQPASGTALTGHLVLAFGAGAQVWWLKEPWFMGTAWPEAAAAFLGTFAYYSYIALLRREAGMPSDTKRWAVAILACALSAIALVLTWMPHAFPRLWLIIVPALLYALPVRSSAGQPIGLRGVPGLKSFVTAWVWAMGTAGLAFAAEEGRVLSLWLTVPVLFAFYLAIAIAFDLRDRARDAPALRTLPQLLGARSAKTVALLCLLPMVLYLAFMAGPMPHAAGERGDPMDLAFLLPLAGMTLPALLILAASPKRGAFHWLLLDACIALPPLLGLIGSRL